MGSLRSLRRREVEPVMLAAPSDEELIEAVQFGTVRHVKALLERGANPDATDKGFNYVLGYVVSGHKLGKTQLLVKHGANVNKRAATQDIALNLASRSAGEKSQKIRVFLIVHGEFVGSGLAS